MHRRHQHINIPTEIIRTIVSIAETGSFSKTGEKLKLGQPAVSAQVKRLQLLVGGPVFEKAPGGVVPTVRGRQVLAHARKMIDANDQILSIGGAVQDRPPLRLGLAALYVDAFLARWQPDPADPAIHFVIDHSAELARGLIDGYVDIGCVVNPPADAGQIIESWTEQSVWVRSRDFVLSPGAPIPLVSWPGGILDRLSVEALEKAGLTYRVVFASADYEARIAAVKARVGLMALPSRKVPDGLVIAKEYYLPALDSLPAGVMVRRDYSILKNHPAIEALRSITPGFKPTPPKRSSASPAILMPQSKSMGHR
ncbi:MAG TPA: LysR family transcriptional regulator [Pseudolabrys sp.]|nr:LysR family transcriptional regulator [Pseudolabrys sp.]